MTQTTSQQDFCSKCGKPKRQLKKMSLTQWMFSNEACNCDSAQVQNYDAHRAREFTSVMELCTECGLPVLTGRLGSMTQWIFGASSCKCNAKLLRDAHAASLSTDSLDGPAAVQALFDSSRNPAAPAVENFHVADEVTALTTELGLPADRYQAVKLVGQGAISKVFECQDRLLQRVVAIKFLIANRWTGEEILRFQTEAKATSKLSHPNIVLVHDFGSTSSGQPYMVLEYFTGVSLEDLVIRKGPLPEDAAAEIGVQIAAGMQFAHSKGVLHRDIKPANIMLIETGEGEGSIVAKVIDFGIADFKSDQSLSVKGHTVVGTPNYMSPDQVQGKKADARSDVYSLGCTLFEALTGRPPFLAETALELVTMHVSTTPPTLKEALPTGEFSEQMEALIKRALQKDPEKRFASMGDMHSALERIYQGMPEEHDESQLQSTELRDTAGGAWSSRRGKLLVGGLATLTLASVFVLPRLVENSKPKTTAPNAKSILPKNDDLHWQSPFGLDIQDNMQGNEVLKSYQHRKSDTDIVVRGANITDDGLDYILHLPLRSASFEDTQIGDKGLKKLCSIKTLRVLNVSHCPQIHAYQYLADRPELRSLFMLNNELTDDTLKYLKPLTKLDTLNISDNPNIHGTGLENLRGTKALETLRMASAQFTTDGIKALSQLTQVNDLNLRYSNIEDKDLDSIVQMQNLKSLSLMGTKITDKGLMKLAALPHLEHLYVGTCKRISSDGLVQLQRKCKKLQIDTNGVYEL